MTTNTDPQYTPENDPEHNIRSDMWSTMTLGQLSRQQELVISKVSAMHQLMGINASRSLQDLYGALQVAMTDLTNLINHRSENKSRN